jgi:hypothetical protein
MAYLHHHHGMSHGRRRRLLAAFFSRFKSDAGSISRAPTDAPSTAMTCVLSACDQPGSARYDSARPNSELNVCDQHAAVIQRWVDLGSFTADP